MPDGSQGMHALIRFSQARRRGATVARTPSTEFTFHFMTPERRPLQFVGDIPSRKPFHGDIHLPMKSLPIFRARPQGTPPSTSRRPGRSRICAVLFAGVL